MATKKKATKKTSTKKPVTKKVATKKTTTKKPASKKTAAKKSTKKSTAKKSTKASKHTPSPLSITAEERYKMVAVAAYHKAEQRGFAPGNEMQDWVDAEKEIDALLYGK